jgi:hypothetical protein
MINVLKWKCDICGAENRETSDYHANLGLISSSTDKKICIKCVNKGKTLEDVKNNGN